jgi:hypothetical protein
MTEEELVSSVKKMSGRLLELAGIPVQDPETPDMHQAAGIVTGFAIYLRDVLVRMEPQFDEFDRKVDKLRGPDGNYDDAEWMPLAASTGFKALSDGLYSLSLIAGSLDERHGCGAFDLDRPIPPAPRPYLHPVDDES